MRRRSLLAALVLVVAGFGLVSCSSPDTTTVSGESTLRSQASVLTKVGVDDTRTYGWNDLVGTTTTDLGTFEVRLLASVDYESGNGPFFGFLTLTAANGDRIAMRMDGDAKVRDDGSTTVVSALKVIDGSGQYVGSAGTGRFIGSRAAQLGSPVEIELTLDLER